MTRAADGGRSTRPEILVELARLKGLSDSVVAFALTLLVLDIRVPAGTPSADLADSVVALAPNVVVYLIAFGVIGAAWGSHQRMLGQIERGDGLLVWYTLISLLPVTLMPASASMLGRYPTQLVAIVVFAGNVIAIQVTELLLWRHAARRRLIMPTLEPRVITGIGRRLAVIALGFGLSIPLALVTPILTYAAWIGVFALVFATEWLSWQQAVRTTRTTIALDGTTRASVHVEHVAGRLHIDAAETDGALIEGVFVAGVKQTVDRSAGEADVHLSFTRLGGLMDQRYPWAWGSSSSLDWDLGIARRVPVSLTIDSRAGVGVLELQDLDLTDLVLRASASEVEVLLPPSAGHTAVHIDSKASDVVVRVPESVVASIHTDLPGSSVVVDEDRFPPLVEGLGYRSTGYETSDGGRVEIWARGSAGMVRVT